MPQEFHRNVAPKKNNLMGVLNLLKAPGVQGREVTKALQFFGDLGAKKNGKITVEYNAEMMVPAPEGFLYGMDPPLSA